MSRDLLLLDEGSQRGLGLLDLRSLVDLDLVPLSKLAAATVANVDVHERLLAAKDLLVLAVEARSVPRLGRDAAGEAVVVLKRVAILGLVAMDLTESAEPALVRRMASLAALRARNVLAVVGRVTMLAALFAVPAILGGVTLRLAVLTVLRLEAVLRSVAEFAADSALWDEAVLRHVAVLVALSTLGL